MSLLSQLSPVAAKKAKSLWDFLTGEGMDPATAEKVVLKQLPPEEAPQRMIEQGYTPDWFHGSTHDVTSYNAKLTNPESDWGQGIYLSNTPEDVEANYATDIGADLTNRIQLLSEQDDIPFDEAKKIIAGETKGITYPSALDESEFAHVGGSTPTWLDELDTTDYEAMARKKLDPKKYDTPEDFEDAVSDEAFNLRLENPESPENELVKVIQKYGGVDTSSMPYIDFTETNTIEDLRDLLSGFEFYDADDNIVGSGAVIADWLKQRGYKGILDHNVNKRFGSERKAGKPMEGMDYDTVHAVVFPGNESVIRSQYGAAFNPEMKGKGGMLDAVAPYVVPTTGILGALAAPDEAAASQPLGTSMAGVKRDPSAPASLVTGAKRGFYKANSPEGFVLGLMDALGAPAAGEIRDKLAQSKFKDDEEKNQLLRLLGEIIGGSATQSPL